MTTFVTSDQHWGHANIIKYSDRKFESIATHDMELIRAWNNSVGMDDEVYHLGDLTLGNINFANELFERLNGTIRVLEYPWHHDSRWIGSAIKIMTSRVKIMKPIVVLEHIIKLEDRWLPLVLCHYPFEAWERSHYGAIHLHGHTHGALHRIPNRLDIGVDMAFKLTGSYRPFQLEEAVDFARSYQPDPDPDQAK
jgi:calcineurin-like phosphoesterase family protein